MNFIKNEIKNYFDEKFLKDIVKLFKFIIIYSVIYLVVVLCFNFLIPIILAIFISFLLKPIKQKILKVTRYKLSNSLVSLLLIFLSIILISFSLSFLGVKAVIQITNFIEYINDENLIDQVFYVIDKMMNNLSIKVNNINSNMINDINTDFKDSIQVLLYMSTLIGKKILNMFMKIPTILIFSFITIFSTYFILKDIEKIESKFKSFFSRKGQFLINKIEKRSVFIVKGYFKAYLIISTVVLIINYTIYKIVGVNNPLILAILVVFLDFIPLVGINGVYIILILNNYFLGNNIQAIILLIGLIIVLLIKELLEQTLIANIIGIHPLVMVATICIAFSTVGILGSIYFFVGVLVYKVVK